MYVNLHDIEPSEKHGDEGPTHAGRIEVDYEYQAEQWVIEIGKDEPGIFLCRVPQLSRQWVRKGSTVNFVEVPWTPKVPDVDEIKAKSKALGDAN